MIRAGVLDDPEVDEAFAFHLWPDLPLGVVGSGAGLQLCFSDPGPEIILQKDAYEGRDNAPKTTVANF
jgi:metal-dependent amidase/aminoacylase/carboxypeptidase family protein